MSTDAIEILEPGLLTTVQDKGRYGYQKFGVPVSGAMDAFALRAANTLVGNHDGAAGLEMTVGGSKVRFLAETLIAVTGADLSPALDGHSLPLWQSVEVSKGSVLSFGRARDGMRSYLAVAGGIDVPVVMGSRSTYLRGGIGGLDGRALKADDVLRTLPGEPDADRQERRLPEHLLPHSYGRHHEVRVVLGPQDKAFTADGIATFLSSEYSISMDSDRMGYRLEGPLIEHVSGPDIVSDGTPLGAIQVPGDGTPIILLADRGTTGGYTKLATVVSSDISKLAQAMPDDTLTFKAVTVEEAHGIVREQEAVLRSIHSVLPGQGTVAKLSIVVESEAFEVVDEGGEAIAVPEVIGDSADTQSHHVRATVDGHTYEFEVEVQQEDRT